MLTGYCYAKPTPNTVIWNISTVCKAHLLPFTSILIFEPNVWEAHNFNNVNSLHSGLTNHVSNVNLFGPPERSPSIYLIVGVLMLFGLWFTSMLTICFVRILSKPGKSNLKHDGLLKSRKILQALEKNLSHQVETYDLKSLNVITSYDNNDNSDHLNWNEVNKILGQSKINMFFSNTQLSTLVSLLHESYIIEAKYLLEKISGTAQKLSVAEDLYIKSQTKKCLLIFPCYSKKCIDKEMYMVMNRVKNKVSDLKHEVITHNRRWRCILAVLHNSCTRFSGFYNVNDISTSSDSFKTTFECKESENPEQVQSFFKDTCDSKNESHLYIEWEIYYIRDSYICVARLIYGYTHYFSDNPQMVDANKQNYSNLHSTKIPTFIHFSLSSQKTSRKWKSGCVQKKHIFQHVTIISCYSGNHCSLACYQKHKQNECKPETCVPRVVHATVEREDEMVDYVPKKILEGLKYSDKIRDLLKNPHLRSLLRFLNDTNKPYSALENVMREPIFVEFSDECLKIVDSNL
uniref:Zinc finger HIT domain-containing protein 3 n=1 Tax=Schistosoma haematobium TaxID=6185 RepID=A0A094ZJV2_SCHHA